MEITDGVISLTPKCAARHLQGGAPAAHSHIHVNISYSLTVWSNTKLPGPLPKLVLLAYLKGKVIICMLTVLHTN